MATAVCPCSRHRHNGSPGSRLPQTHAAGAEPLIIKPICPDSVILAGLSGSVAPAQYQRSQSTLITETLYA